MALPSMAYRDGIRKAQTVTFGGYDHNIGSQDGAIWDMKNMTSDYYPVLASRPARHKVRTLSNCGGLFAHDGLFWVDGDGFYKVQLVSCVFPTDKALRRRGRASFSKAIRVRFLCQKYLNTLPLYRAAKAGEILLVFLGITA